MARKTPFTSLAALCLTAICVGLGSFSCAAPETNTHMANTQATRSPAPGPCDSMNDPQIVDAIYGRIVRASPELAAQIRKINVVSEKAAVTLMGWVATEDQMSQVIDIATKTACVKSVDRSNFYGSEDNPTRPSPTGSCSGNTVKCGDICIPSPPGGCSLSAPIAPVDRNSSTPSNSNANTPANTNSNSNTVVNTNTMKKP